MYYLLTVGHCKFKAFNTYDMSPTYNMQATGSEVFLNRKHRNPEEM